VAQTNNRDGQSVVEFLMAAPILLSIGLGCLTLTYTFLTHLWVQTENFSLARSLLYGQQPSCSTTTHWPLIEGFTIEHQCLGFEVISTFKFYNQILYNKRLNLVGTFL
jgi:hypothetical protein